MQVTDAYPGDAAYGADYFSRAAQGEVVVYTHDGPTTRPERVIVTDIYEDHVGRVCLGERTVRHLAHLFGMVDDWRVAMIADDNQALRLELITISADLAAERARNALLAQIERPEAQTVYVSIDHATHASRRAAAEQSAQYLGAIPAILADAGPVADQKESVSP